MKLNLSYYARKSDKMVEQDNHELRYRQELAEKEQALKTQPELTLTPEEQP